MSIDALTGVARVPASTGDTTQAITALDPSATGTRIVARTGGSDMSRRVAERLGKSDVPIDTSLDISTPEGRDLLSRCLEYQAPENAKVNEGWYGREFDLIGYVSREVVARHSPDGEVYADPRVLCRTILVASDGSMLVSSSDYLYESLSQIISFCGWPSLSNPIRVKLGKGGAADKLFRVYDSPSVSRTPSKKAR